MHDDSFRGTLDPSKSLEAWLRGRGDTEAEIATTRSNLPAWLEALRDRQGDPLVRAAQDAALKDWEARHAGERREVQREVLRLAGVPEGFWVLAMDPPERTEPIALVSTWLATQGRWLVMSGVPGCGKSIAGAAAILEHGHGRWLDIFEVTRTGDGKRDKGDRELWQRCERAALLVVDDLGIEDPESRERLTRLLAARDNYGRRTIVTTNIEPAALAGYDRRVTDRLMGSMKLLAGGSLR